ncbi:MAG TPA: hypothetical protein VKT32_04490 [Chthonomonadaceae bacterium]|nr:hypothetical protein [Chthonomonadaceae bacterium]
MAAPGAPAAADHAGQQHAVAALQAGHPFPDLGDPPGRLVTDDQRRAVRQGLDGLRRRAVFMNIRAADRRPADLDDHLARPRMRIGIALQGEPAVSEKM